MKKLIALFALASFTALAAEAPTKVKVADPEARSAVQAVTDRVSIDVFGALNSSDLDRANYLAGAGLNFDLTDYLAVGSEVAADETDGVFVDRVSASLIYKIPLTIRSRPYVFAGAWYEFEDEQTGQTGQTGESRRRGKGGDYKPEPPRVDRADSSESNRWGIHFGVGLEHRIAGPLGAFGDVRMVKPLEGNDTSPSAYARAGVRFHF